MLEKFSYDSKQISNIYKLVYDQFSKMKLRQMGFL